MKEYTVRVYDGRHTVWYLGDEIHREDGPAVEWSDGSKFWYRHGVFHREDGPARIFADGTKEWWLNGESVTEIEHRRMTSNVKEFTVEEIQILLGYKIKIVA